MLPFSREIYIDRDDFAEDPPKGFRRLSPGAEVRLRYAYIIRCDEVVRNEEGEVVELRCSYDPATRTGEGAESRAARGTIHWVSAAHSIRCEVRLYDRLFTVPDPDAEEGDFKDYLNPRSLVVAPDAAIEPSVADDAPGTRYQFERLGYFCSDRVESTRERPIYNRTVTLRDTWARTARTAPAPGPAAAKAPGKPTAPPRPKSAAPAPEAHRSPELEDRRRRYVAELGIPAEEADILTRDLSTSDLFEAALPGGASAKGVANWVIHELPREAGDRTLANLPFSGRELGELVVLVENGTLSSSGGRQVLSEMVNHGGEPAELVERLGLRQVSDAAALVPAVEEVLAANPAKAEEYRGGKAGLMGFFIGQVMRKTGGKAN